MTNKTDKLLIAGYTYEHNDGDQMWMDVCDFYINKSGILERHFEDGYDGKIYVSTVSKEEIRNEMEKVKKSPYQYGNPKYRGGYDIHKDYIESEIVIKVSDNPLKKKKPLQLQEGDLVLFSNGDVRMIMENTLCEKTKLGIFSYNTSEQKHYCTTYAGNYNSNLNHRASDCFNIEKIVCKTNPNYKFFSRLHYNNDKIPLHLYNPSVFDWSKEDFIEIEFKHELSIDKEREDER